MNPRSDRPWFFSLLGALLFAGLAAGASVAHPLLELRSADTGSGLLYVGNIDGKPGLGNIFVYSAGLHSANPQPLRTLSNGTMRPSGMWVDRFGVLYVTNISNGRPSYVDEFRPGQLNPFLRITEGLYNAQSVAVADDGTVYVNNTGSPDSFVTVYAPGSTHVLRTIDLHLTGYAHAAAQMAFDSSGNLYASVSLPRSNSFHVVLIPRGTSFAHPFRTLQNVGGPGLGFDGADNMYVSSNRGILVFAPGSHKVLRILPAGGYLTVTRSGIVYALGGKGVAEFAPGGTTPVNTFAIPPSFSFGVAAGRDR